MSPHPSEESTFQRLTFELDGPEEFPCDACGEDMCETLWDPLRQRELHLVQGVYATREVKVALCSACAGEIANFYNKAHGGEWLTWPNPPKPVHLRDRWRISPGLRRDVYERDLYRCRYCGAGRDLAVDHVIPITDERCTNGLENLVTCCQPCNSRKGSRTPEQAGMTVLPEPAGTEV